MLFFFSHSLSQIFHAVHSSTTVLLRLALYCIRSGSPRHGFDTKFGVGKVSRGITKTLLGISGCRLSEQVN